MKKIILSTLLLFSFAAFSVAQETPAVTNSPTKGGETIKVRHWSLLTKGGMHFFRTSTRDIKEKHNYNGFTAGAALEYTFNPLFGVGLDWTYNKFNRPFYLPGTNNVASWRSHTNDFVLFGSVNLTNLLGKYRDAQKFNIYGNVGLGAFYLATGAYGVPQANLENRNSDKSTMMAMAGLNAEWNLSRVIALHMGLEYRYYFKDQLSGFNEGVNAYVNDRQQQNSDSWGAVLGLRFKFGAKSKQHARNTSIYEYYPILQTVNNITNVTEKADLAPITQKLNAMEKSTSALEEKVGKIEADVKQLSERQLEIVRNAYRNLEFDFNSARIRATSYSDLDALAHLLMSNPTFKLTLAGGTDNIGSDAYNKKLSERRANSVKEYLLGKGVNASAITVEANGKSKPIASNETAIGRQANRYVIIDVQPE